MPRGSATVCALLSAETSNEIHQGKRIACDMVEQLVLFFPYTTAKSPQYSKILEDLKMFKVI